MNDEALAYNLFELERYKHVKVELTGNALRYVYQPLADERGVLAGFAPPPRMFKTDQLDPSTRHLSASERRFLSNDPSYLETASAHLALDRWGEAVKAAMADRSLSPEGRHTRVVSATEQALSAVGKRFAALEEIAAKLARQHADLYAVPRPDQVDAMIDVHLYAKADGMSTADIIGALMDGKHDRLLLALARSPMPLPDVVAERVNDAWAQKVRAEKPAETAALGLAEQANEWARGVVRFIGALLANPNTSRTTGAFEPLAIYKTLRAVNAIGLLDYRDEQIVQFERRIAQIAA